MIKAGQKYSYYRHYSRVCLGKKLQVLTNHSSHQIVSSSKFQYMAAPHIAGFIYISIVHSVCEYFFLSHVVKFLLLD